MTERAATFYVRRDKVFVTSESKTIDGLWITTPPFVVRDSSTPDREIAALLLDALAASTVDVPNIPVSENPFRPVLKLAGARSFGTFVRGAKAVSATSDGHEVTLTPLRNAGPRGGFEFPDMETCTIPANVDAVAEPLRMARKLATDS